MSVLRWFVSIFMALVLAIVLIVSLPTTAAIQQATSVKTIKVWLQDSNFYEDFLAATFEELARDIFDSTETFPLVSNRQVLEEIENSFPQNFLQNIFETILDAYYDYLRGREDTINFNISLVEISDNLKTNIPRLLKETIANLPPCPGNSQQDYEQFERGECLPPAVDKNELYRTIDNAIQSDIIFDDENLTAEDLNVNYEELQPIRRGFQILQSIPLICYGLMLLFSTIILIATPRPIKKGLLVLGLTWLPCTFLVGTIAVASRSFSLQVVQGLVRESSPNVDPIIQSLLLNFFIEAYQSISDRILLISGVGFAFGIVCIVLSAIRLSTSE